MFYNIPSNILIRKRGASTNDYFMDMVLPHDCYVREDK